MNKIYPVRLGVTIGILWGIIIFLFALLVNKKIKLLFFKVIEEVYPGCSSKTIFGPYMCGLMGFLDGFIGGLLIGLLYNNISINY